VQKKNPEKLNSLELDEIPNHSSIEIYCEILV